MADLSLVSVNEIVAGDEVFLTIPARVIRLFQDDAIKCAMLKFEGMSNHGLIHYFNVPVKCIRASEKA